MKRLIAIICIPCCALLCGCGDGIGSNYREIEQLLVIQAMGFDKSEDGLTLSVSSGSGGMGGQSEASQETVRMRATADTLLTAQEIIEDHSSSEELFFDHTSYIVIGRAAAEASVVPYLDYIERNDAFRLDVPLFAVLDGTAEDIIIGTGNKSYDSVSVLSSVQRNLISRGEAYVYSAGEIAADLNANGSALICAVKAVEARAVLPDAQEGEKTAVFDGYGILREGKLVGRINADDALAVNLLLGRSGPTVLCEEAEGCTAAIMLTGCSSDIAAIYDGDELCGIEVRLKVDASLSEYRGKLDSESLNRVFREDIRDRACSVLSLSRELDCDFLQLGALLSDDDPLSLHSAADELSEHLRDIYIYIYVETDINLGFILAKEVGI